MSGCRVGEPHRGAGLVEESGLSITILGIALCATQRHHNCGPLRGGIADHRSELRSRVGMGAVPKHDIEEDDANLRISGGRS